MGTGRRGEEEKRRKGEKEAGKSVIKSRDQVGNYLILSYDMYIYMVIYIYMVRLEIPYPHWKVCLGGMLRRYASGFASGVCFGVCFA